MIQKKSVKFISVLLSVITFTLIGSLSISADPATDSELVLQDGYVDGHTFRYLEKHVDARITFKVVTGEVTKRKDKESLTNKLLTGEFMYTVDSLTINLQTVDLSPEQSAGSPRIFRYLQNHAAELKIQPRFDTPGSLYFAKLLAKMKMGVPSPLLSGNLTAWFSETVTREGVKTEEMTVAVEGLKIP